MRGPQIVEYGATSHDLIFDCSFRVISAYCVATDELLVRLDAKVANRQYSVGFNARLPVIATGTRIPDGDLVSPNSGIQECVNVKSAKIEIIRALRELTNDLENDVADLPLNGR